MGMWNESRKRADWLGLLIRKYIYIYMTLKEGMAICRFIVPQTTTALCDFEERNGM
jgi:hypothetical protein